MSVQGQRWILLGDTTAIMTANSGKTFTPFPLPSDVQKRMARGSSLRNYGVKLLDNGVVLWHGTLAWFSDLSGHWRDIAVPVNWSILNGASSHGSAYLLLEGPCLTSTIGGCSAELLVVHDDGTSAVEPVPEPIHNYPQSVTVLGSDVWVLVTLDGGQTGQVLKSSDGGMHFSSRLGSIDDSCIEGSLSASSNMLIWGFCIGGNMGSGIVSTDGGAHFRGFGESGPALSNSGQVSAVDPQSGLLATGSAIYYSVKQGQRWQAAQTPELQVTDQPITFASDGAGPVFAIVTPDPDVHPAPKNWLWESIDSGHTWTAL